MAPNPFVKAAPASGSISWEDLKGRLLLVEPLEVLADPIATTNGEQTGVVRANVSVLDGDEAGTVYEETLIFPKVLKNQTKNRVGAMVLGRLGQGQKKPGQNAPWILEDYTEADLAVGTEFLNKRQAAKLGAPAASGTAPWE